MISLGYTAEKFRVEIDECKVTLIQYAELPQAVIDEINDIPSLFDLMNKDPDNHMAIIKLLKEISKGLN